MQIGNHIIGSGAVLAPMAGFTDLPFRLICREFGCVMSVTEMISAKGLVYTPNHGKSVKQLYNILPQEGIVALQLFGHEKNEMVYAAKLLEDAGCAMIDINMGCPVNKVVSSGDGSALMKDVSLAGELVYAVANNIKIPVTVKFRSGWDEAHINCVEFAKVMQSSGAQALTLHARTRNQMYSGKANWAHIAAVKCAVTVPVFGNGDIHSGQDALRMMKETNCDGVMIGRKAQGNPWIFAEVAAAVRGVVYKTPTARQRITTALHHCDMMQAYKGSRVAVCEMRKHLTWYIKGMRGATDVRERINGCGSMEAVRDELRAYLLILESFGEAD